MGRYLGGVRKRRNISQRSVAKQIGWSRPHLSNIEMGRSRAGWKGLREMATILGYGVRELVAEVEREMPAAPAAPITDRELAETSAAQPWPTRKPAAAHAFEQDVEQSLRDYDHFVIAQYRTLDVRMRNKVARFVKELVQQRFDQSGDE